jgi:serine/threonine-protein kinase
MSPERWQQVDHLYHAALERGPEQREAFLRGACQSDDELLREVESLLARDASGDPMLERPAWEAEPSLLSDSTSTAMVSGTRLGPYLIETLLGKGGMGQVYKARDTRLGRAVALKILAERFRGRLEREARAASALNHPHICTVHDVGPDYLVMELVEGETLAERLKRGALPASLVLQYGAQIADALAAAHARGIIHRDLKPGNIMLTKSGVKVLDFGLAKSLQDETITAPHMVMGSPAYMAPEQRAGNACDARTDIYALGLVLYEMAAGQRIPQEPAPAIAGVDAQLAPIVERCLAPDPEDRWQAAKDIKAVLEWSSKSKAAPSLGYSRRITVAAIAILVIIAVAASWEWWRGRRAAPLRPLIRLEAEIPSDTPIAINNGGGLLALSPDGSRVALTLTGGDGKVRLYMRLLSESQFEPLGGTEDASFPFFSPDGQWIGFFANGKLKKISVAGSAPVILCDAPRGAGASWGDDGNIVFNFSVVSGLARDIFVALARVSSGGGVLVTLTNPRPLADDFGNRFPQVLPGSQAVLFTTHNNLPGSDNDTASISVLSLKTGQIKTIQQGGYSGRYVATPGGHGRLIYMRRGTLFAAPFNLDRLAVTGPPVRVLEGITSGGGGGNFAFSSNGTFVYLAGDTQQGYWKISLADVSGKAQPLDATAAPYFTPRFSPDGKRLAFSIARANGSDLWVKDLDRDTPPSRLTFLAGLNQFPVWTPDGKSIIFKHQTAMSWIRSDGAGEAQPLTNGRETPRSISPDGKRLAFASYVRDRDHPDIVTAPLEGNSDHLRLGKAAVFLKAPLADSSPMFSPDGKWLAYMSTELGSAEIYVRPFPGPGGRWQISTSGGTLPVWSPNGRELLYLAPDQRLMVVSYTVRGDSFSPDRPRVWSGPRVMSPFGPLVPCWDLAPDGKHLAAVLAPSFGPLTFLLNFFDELERRSPPGQK